jgi:hypothetical protein
VVIGILLGVQASDPALLRAQPACSILQRFQRLVEQIPEMVGDCLEDEQVDATTGDVQQPTTGGVLRWRQADGLTSFTDGSTTWLLGPEGLVSRPNDAPPFIWESAPAVAPTATGPIDVRKLILTIADVQAEGHGDWGMDERNSGFEERPDGSAQATTTLYKRNSDPFEPGVLIGVVIRHADTQAAEEAMRHLWGSTHQIDGMKQFPKVEDWMEVDAPRVADQSRAFRARGQAVIYKARDGSAVLTRINAGWLWTRRANFVHSVGMIALEHLVSTDAVWPRLKVVDGRVERALVDPTPFVADPAGNESYR